MTLRRHVPAGSLAPLGPANILNLAPPNVLNLPTPMICTDSAFIYPPKLAKKVTDDRGRIQLFVSACRHDFSIYNRKTVFSFVKDAVVKNQTDSPVHIQNQSSNGKGPG